MKRRDFILNTGIASASFLFFGNKLWGKDFQHMDDIKIWLELIDYARWCPSPHNMQPWRIKLVSATEVHLYYDNKRLLIDTDPTSCFTIIGMGMFIESLNIAANPLGYSVVAEHEPEQRLDYSAKEPKLFAKLKLLNTEIQEPLNRELIKQRKTSRLHYDGKILTPEIINSLSQVATANGQTFVHSSEKEMVDFILELNRETLFYDLDDDKSRIELSRLIRTTDKEAAEKKDGLWSHCMGFPGRLMHNFFFHHERFKSSWKRKILGKVYQYSMHGTSNVAWISGKFETREDWLNAGKMLQRLWLEMTKYNVYLHPFGSVITNPEAHEKFQQKIKHDKNKGELWLLVRMGYSNEPPRSFRLDTKGILI